MTTYTASASSYRQPADTGSKVLAFARKAIAQLHTVLIAKQSPMAYSYAQSRDHVQLVYRMANEVESLHPSLASELRAIASRA